MYLPTSPCRKRLKPPGVVGIAVRIAGELAPAFRAPAPRDDSSYLPARQLASSGLEPSAPQTSVYNSVGFGRWMFSCERERGGVGGIPESARLPGVTPG